MSTTLTPAETGRIIALLGMLASDHDGERANAGLLVSRLIRSKGLTWSDLLVPRIVYSPTPPPPRKPEPYVDWPEQAARCLRCDEFLSQWERQFLRNILYRRTLKPLTFKQMATLETIVANVAQRGQA